MAVDLDKKIVGKENVVWELDLATSVVMKRFVLFGSNFGDYNNTFSRQML